MVPSRNMSGSSEASTSSFQWPTTKRLSLALSRTQTSSAGSSSEDDSPPSSPTLNSASFLARKASNRCSKPSLPSRSAGSFTSRSMVEDSEAVVHSFPRAPRSSASTPPRPPTPSRSTAAAGDATASAPSSSLAPLSFQPGASLSLQEQARMISMGLTAEGAPITMSLDGGATGNGKGVVHQECTIM